MKMLEIRNVSKNYVDDRKEPVKALKEVSLSFPSTGLVVLAGTSGCGKSTMLNILAGLDKPTSGEVYLDEVRLDDQNEEWWDSFRASNLGFVYQDFNLLENMTVRENIRLPIELQDIGEEVKEERLQKLANELGLTELLNKKAVLFWERL